MRTGISQRLFSLGSLWGSVGRTPVVPDMERPGERAAQPHDFPCFGDAVGVCLADRFGDRRACLQLPLVVDVSYEGVVPPVDEATRVRSKAEQIQLVRIH